MVAEFGFCFRNSPELVVEGRITTKSRIEYYFKAFDSVSIVFVEIKLKIGNLKERLDALRRAMASRFTHTRCGMLLFWIHSVRLEQHRERFESTRFRILCDGKSFKFFSFDSRVLLYLHLHAVAFPEILQNSAVVSNSAILR